ncbi:MAG: Ldh family oxidoreductase [Hyphomicrobiales bacterium]|nr:Ldh family oxidoreductase [Hyphomicrobiales bacterium]
MPRIDPADLERFYREAFAAAGATSAAADAGAAGLLYADVHGIDTHGAENFDRLYLAKLRNGQVDGQAEPALILDWQGVGVIEADGCLGFLAASRAMELAVDKAGRFGIGAVGVRNSNHCGALGYYTSSAADAGFLGIGFTNLGTEVYLRPPNGRLNLLGTNVIAASSPTQEMAPFTLDMSVASSSVSRIRAAQRNGERIPPGWLADEHGRPVTEPAAFSEGTAFLQFLDGMTQGHKGYGLAILIDLFCGILIGGSVGPARMNFTPSKTIPRRRGVGHFFIAVNVDAFQARGDFQAAMDDMLKCLVDCPPVDSNADVKYPGLRRQIVAAERRQKGVPLAETLLERLLTVGRRHGISPPREM